MHRRTVLLAPALIVLFNSSAPAQPAAFDFKAEFDRARGMPRELQPRIARIGLLFFSDAMMRARIQQAPFGYEKDEGFRKAVSDMQAALNKILSGEKAELGDTLAVPGDAESMMASKYEGNREKIAGFLADMRKPAGPLRQLPDVEILRYQLWVATLMAARQRDVWEVVWKFTGFFPFC